MPNLPKHILVIRLSAMGDVAMTVPVLRALTQAYPELKITVLTRGFFVPFFRDLKQVEVLSADLKNKHKGILGLYKLSKEIKALQIDAVADLHNVLRSNILKLFLIGKPCKQINKGRPEKKALTTGEIFHQLKTTHQRYADVFQNLGFTIDLSNPNFPEKSTLNKNCKAVLGTFKQKQIGIAPFAAHEGKMYPLALMKEVIQALSKDYKVYLFGGGKKEMDALNNMANSFENVINLAGKLTLNEELDVISNLDVMLSMDSGNAHIAAMLGVKVITIWGVTHPYAGFAPFNQPFDYLLTPDRAKFPKIPTSIYGNKFPEGYEKAAATITPSVVVNTLKSIL